MKVTLSFIIALYSITVFAQEKLYPLRYTKGSISYTNQISTRSSDSVNEKISYEPSILPFFDEFSTEKRVQSDFRLNTVAGESYVYGDCAGFNNYISKDFKFSNTQTYSYFFNHNTNLKDSIATTIANIIEFNNIPNCDVPSNFNVLFPVCYNYNFDNQGNKIDSFITSYDTILHVAFVKEYKINNEVLWLDNYACINDKYPYMPYSKGVATLDGLNQYGRPYQPFSFDAYGIGDYLTSIPLDLSGITRFDSLYLSFLLQPQGFGDWPNKQDSFLVEFKDSNNEWHLVKSIVSLDRELDTSALKFSHYLIYVPDQNIGSDPIYYHDSFQFRFSSYATLTGNNDHWNIDYVKLDTARTYNDTIIKDAAFAYELSTILKNYTLMSSKQFTGINDMKDTIYGVNHNIIPSPILSTFLYKCENKTNSSVYFATPSGIPYLAEPVVFLPLFSKRDFNISTPLADSTVIKTSVFIEQSDGVPTNDTASISQLFFNEMAYDDGSAEMAYGIEGLGVKKVAYKFTLNKQDTLAAIKIHFSNIDKDVSNLVFNLNVWKNIGFNGNEEELLKTITNITPKYDSINKNSFYTFGLDTPIIVKDSFYVGWTQADENNLQIGYDRNSTLGLQHLFKFTNNVWSKSSVVDFGTPMIRVILDGTRDYRPKVTATIAESISQNINWNMYPNPANNIVTVSGGKLSSHSVLIYDLSGRLVLNETFKNSQTFDISTIKSGMYIVNISSDGLVLHSSKLIIQH